MEDNINDALSPIAEEMAQDLVDEEISHHPELLPQRDRLIKTKVHETKDILSNTIQSVLDDIKITFEYLSTWLNTQEREDKERLLNEFEVAAQESQTDEFFSVFQNHIEQDPKKEIKNLQSVLKLSDKTLESIYSEGYKLQMKKEFKYSKALFRFLTLLNPYISEYWINLGFAFMNLNLYPDADYAFNIATKINPENPQGLYFSAICAIMQKDLDKASSFCEDGLALTKSESGEADWKHSFLELKNSLKNEKVLKETR